MHAGPIRSRSARRTAAWCRGAGPRLRPPSAALAPGLQRRGWTPRPSASRLDAEIVASRVRDESLNRAVATRAVDPHPSPEPPGYPGGERYQGLRRRVATSSRACGCAW